MRTTIILDDEIVEKAKELTKISEKTALIHVALRELIAKYSRLRLAALGGSDKKAQPIKRRRSR